LKIVGNSQFQKTANSILILNHLRGHSLCSRALLSKSLGLQPSTVTYIVNRLIDLGLVHETVEGQKTGSGRKPILLQLNNRFGYTVGLDLQADYYQFVITDLGGDIILSGRRDYTQKIESFSVLVEFVIDEILIQINEIKDKILRICLALPGIVDTNTSTVIDCWTHSLKNYQIPDELGEKFDFPIIIENDANCCSWNKLWESGDDTDDSFIYLLTRFHNPQLVPESMPPVGIGLGLVLDGEVFRGYRNMAGEFRSIFYRDGGTGQISLSNDDLRSLPDDKNIKRKLILELLRNILFLVPILNPRIIYIGGDLTGEDVLVRDILENEMKNEFSFIGGMECGLTVLGEDCSFDAAKGAAVLSQKQLFSIPKVGDTQLNSLWYDYLTGKAGE
jgi:DNA-binding transcriptional ArsR family regulator